jgi:acetyl-CoA carboxylase carboxyl transferase subunit alpha
MIECGVRMPRHTMAESHKPKETSSGSSRPRHALEFEKPIIDLEKKIEELETLSKSTGMNLNGEVKPLKERLGMLIREVFHGLSPWQSVQVARHSERPLTSDYIEALIEDFIELHGDRQFGDDRAIVTGIGRLGRRRVMVVGHRKGPDFKEKVKCNFGSAHPEGYRKALRKMKLAEKFKLPIVAFINTPGAYPGIGAEERGQAWAIAENLREMFGLRVPVVSVVIGEGGSGGALGIGIGDRVLMLDHSYYSVISPEGCAAILWGDAKKMADAAKALKLTAKDLKRLGIVDEVVEEPVGGAHRNPAEMFKRLAERLEHHFAELESLTTDDLLARRYEKFRRMGSKFATPPEIAPPAEKPASGQKPG